MSEPLDKAKRREMHVFGHTVILSKLAFDALVEQKNAAEILVAEALLGAEIVNDELSTLRREAREAADCIAVLTRQKKELAKALEAKAQSPTGKPAMALAYLAGPYRSKDGIWGVKRNVEAALSVARELWKQGYAVICPHANTALMDGPDIPDAVFLEGDIEMLRRCDVIVMLPGWEQSAGAAVEHQVAKELGLVIAHWDWVAGRAIITSGVRS